MKKVIFTSCLLLFFMSCSNDKKENSKDLTVDKNQKTQAKNDCSDFLMKRKQENLNISILLDLSDRIDLPNQQVKDSAYILSLAKAFNTHIKGKKLGLLYDKMEVFFEPVPSDPKINQISNQLKISYIKGVSKKEWMPKTLNLYENNPSLIYNLARSSSIKGGYPGSDTWRFFKDHVKDYCIESCRRNILVILTDGYMYHEKSIRNSKNQTSYLTPQYLSKLALNTPNWKEIMEKRNLGFIPANNNLNDLEVLVIGIENQNSKHPYAQDIIETYWYNWLKSMGVKNPKIKNSDLPSNIEKIIFNFILNK
ncbi:hypothetical protein Q4Q39_06805 [Flavivirga amylovorans]|uniref:VWA domain-containing protein n=1 Tax=Flavivirga amylovorans TaxID=870486 RepID=A0ABT8WZQ2_9FLAO|nr:hypothetical protein [Flavivirga amylovorans]MDO5987117.1 hypothetical protein [Flavivirga amylovorans]